MKKFFLFLFVIIGTISFSQNPLFIPSTISGTIFNLNVQNGTTQFFPSINTPTYGINGPLLGPTLLLSQSTWVTMNVTNNLTGNGNSTTMHWHGLHVPAVNDGGPHQVIAQNSTWISTFQILNSAGTFWYHPHGEGKTDLQVSKGLAGMIIVTDPIEAALTLPRTYGIDDFPIIVQTKSFDILNQIAVSTEYDTVPMVNGTVNPYLNAPAQVVRLRLLNGSSGRTFMFGFSNNMNFHLIATDGGLIDTSLTMNRLLLANGERAEILVDLSALLNDSVYLMSYGSEIPNGIMGADSVGDATNQVVDYYNNFLNGADFNLLHIFVGPQTSSPVTTIPNALAPLSPWLESSATINRQFVLDTLSSMAVIPNPAEGPFGINRKSFDMDSINEIVYLNDIEIWTLHNKTMVAHPFHIHDVEFFILDVNGGAVPDYEQGQKDVVLVLPGDSVRFITKFTDFSNDTVPYMYHCHLLHHEDEGMMGSFIVVDTTGLSVSEISSNNSIVVFPNPASDLVEIKLNNFDQHSPITIAITNSLGQVIFNSNVLTTSIKLSTQNFANGLYFISVSQNEKVVKQKLIVNH